MKPLLQRPIRMRRGEFLGRLCESDSATCGAASKTTFLFFRNKAICTACLRSPLGRCSTRRVRIRIMALRDVGARRQHTLRWSTAAVESARWTVVRWCQPLAERKRRAFRDLCTAQALRIIYKPHCAYAFQGMSKGTHCLLKEMRSRPLSKEE
jgi:hypothetical protein